MAIAMTACKTQLHEPEQSTDSTDPMRFTSFSESEREGAFAPARLPETTRATALTQGFLVSCWKGCGTTAQHIVMDKYEVQYESDPWYNTSSWGYVSGGSHSFYQTQYERYWDYSHFPYRFYAITPCPEWSDIPNFGLTYLLYLLPNSVQYERQTCTNGLTTTGAEPYMVAQVERRTDGRDYDLMIADKDNPGERREINTGSTTLSRKVALPFHHLTSKIRFGFYCQDLGEPEGGQNYEVYDIRIDVANEQFTTAAKGYSASLLSPGSMIEGDFLERTKVSSAAASPLLTMSADGSEDNYMSKCRDRKTAYFCQCKDGMLAIPQKDVQLRVSFRIKGRMIDDNLEHDYPGGGNIRYDEGSNETIYSNLLLMPTMDDGTTVDRFDWEENTLYTYYIVVSRYYMHPIVLFTCTLTPWEDVYGELSTDLEQ